MLSLRHSEILNFVSDALALRNPKHKSVIEKGLHLRFWGVGLGMLSHQIPKVFILSCFCATSQVWRLKDTFQELVLSQHWEPRAQIQVSQA